MDREPLNAKVAEETLNVAHRLLLEVREWAEKERDAIRAASSRTPEARQETMNACTRVIMECEDAVTSTLHGYHGIAHLVWRKRDMVTRTRK